MYKFFIENNQINGDKVIIKGDDFNHIANVLRMKNGENILLTSKQDFKTYICNINYISRNEVICNILDEYKSKSELNIDIDLYQGIPKSDKMEYIIQKAVELGVNKIFPVNMKNCIAKINDKEKKIARWNKISEVAAKQSKRDVIPSVEKEVNVQYICDNINKYNLVIVAYENEEKISIKDILRSEKYKDIQKIAIVVGPEGGLKEEEIENMKAKGAKIVSLGKRILRTETASVTILSMIMYEYDL